MTEGDKERTEITSVVQDYFDGMMYGDKAKLQNAFHDKAFIVGHFEGELSWMPRDEFADFCAAESTLTDGDPYEARIENIDVAGAAASAKVVNKELGTWYTDYLSLLKIDGAWVIINKAYFAHPAS